MTAPTNVELARAFSGHRFAETYDHLADAIVWNLVGAGRIEGRAAVVAACEDTVRSSAGVRTDWLRFVVTADGPVVAVDVIGRYEGPDGISGVASCDVYEFVGGEIAVITSYTVEVDPEAPFGP